MNNTVVFEFDKIITIKNKKIPKNIFEACYGNVPRAFFRQGSLVSIFEQKCSGKQIILHARGDERMVKEILWFLNACSYFDEIRIDGEGNG